MQEAQVSEGSLKYLNRLHFSHILERVTKAEADLEQQQCLLHNSRDDISLLHRVNQMKLNLLNLKYIEKTFFTQKLKCNFLKKSDRGTSFFHALMRHKHRKSFIPFILRSNGALTTYIDEVGAEFVHYYPNLLRISSFVSPIDVVVVYSGPYLDESHYSFLLVPFSNEIVKETLFSIGNDKAPGPDVYSSLFYKKSWDIVGADFCAAL